MGTFKNFLKSLSLFLWNYLTCIRPKVRVAKHDAPVWNIFGPGREYLFCFWCHMLSTWWRLCVCRGNQQDTCPPSRHAATHTLILLQIGPCSLIITHSRPCLLSGGCLTPNMQPEKRKRRPHHLQVILLLFVWKKKKNSTLLLELSMRWHQGFLQLSPGVKQFRSPSRTLGFVDSAVRCNQVRSEILWCFDVS